MGKFLMVSSTLAGEVHSCMGSEDKHTPPWNLGPLRSHVQGYTTNISPVVAGSARPDPNDSINACKQ